MGFRPSARFQEDALATEAVEEAWDLSRAAARWTDEKV